MNYKLTSISPSNIALVKYWGKRDVQIPMNPSISFTLSESKTITDLELEICDKFSYEFYFEGKEQLSFHQKLDTYFERVLPHLSFLNSYKLKIDSKNTFPHSTGIASSAASYSALSLGLCHLEAKITGKDENLIQKASLLSRLGSGSACRSLFPELASWGDKSNEFASCETMHEKFKDYLDYILIADSSKKQVSSTVGHNLMNDHPYRENRILEAGQNYKKIHQSLVCGDEETFCDITIKEALSLHALMMSSRTPFVLMKPNTLSMIEKIEKYRSRCLHPITYTLDAGPNIHLLFSSKYKDQVESFINEELLCDLEDGKMIKDKVGKGPEIKWS